MSITRRTFLKHGGLALVTFGVVPSFLRQLALAGTAPRRKVLVCVFQRGAVDGLSQVVPFGDKSYYTSRADIAIAAPTQQAGAVGALDLDGFYGLHPALTPLFPLYKAGNLAFVHACGSPSATRSHFDAQDFMEAGVVDNKNIGSGWLNRLLLACPEDAAKLTPFRGVSLTATLPRSLQGDHEALAIPDLRNFGVGGNARFASKSSQTAAGFEGMYDAAVGDVLGGTGKEAFNAIEMLKKINPAGYQAANGAQYPNGLGRSLQQVAQLIKADVGVEVACAEIGGWDTHANQGNATGQLANRFTEFGSALAAFQRDMGDRMADVVVVCMSEFGRTVKQNGNRGTDHGHATCFTLLGGPVKGGKVYGKWPGLAKEQLNEGRDLAVTTDYRQLLAEVAQQHFGAKQVAPVFPNFKLDPARWLGVVRA